MIKSYGKVCPAVDDDFVIKDYYLDSFFDKELGSR